MLGYWHGASVVRPKGLTIMKRRYGVLPFITLFIGCGSVDDAKIPVAPRTPKIIDCPECDGYGKVYYGPEHPIVKMGFDVGEYNCPMCEGGGKLAED
jgi:hypothetical protein